MTLKLNGTPHSIEQAISNALNQIETVSNKDERVKIVREHLREFIANVTISADERTQEDYIQLFETIFGLTPKGYLLALQWYQDAKKLAEFQKGDVPDEMARSATAILGRPNYILTEKRPRCPIGSVLFRINQDDSLTLLETNYDST